MASPKHSVFTKWSNAGDSIQKTVTIAADAETNFDVAVNTGVTNQAVAFTLDRSKAQVLFIVSTTAVTIKTNDSGSPTDTLALTAGVPKAWTLNDGIDECPFTGDVTGLYVSNASGSQAIVSIRCAYDL